MLSAEQKKLKNLTKLVDGIVSSIDESYSVRRVNSEYDENRVSELWANLTMIQQMNGNDHWLALSNKSGKSWQEFITKLIKSRGSRVIVFENSEMIFGFAYMVLENKNANNPKQKPSLKATIKELYLEPKFRKQANKPEMAEMMQTCLMDMGIEFIEFDVKDL